MGSRIIQVAIDGPAASGKSSVGKKLANMLGYLFLDTGVMYRAVTWAALAHAIDIRDENQVTRLAEQVNIEIFQPSVEDGRMNGIFVDGIDITWDIRTASVNEHVSEVSKYAGVRGVLTTKQREIAQKGDIVMVGRDIGTIVLPKAEVKIFLLASIEERARRRFIEERKRGSEITVAEIIQNLKHRDEIDSTRSIAPLVPAGDAVQVDTNGKTVDEVVKEILDIVQCKIKSANV